MTQKEKRWMTLDEHHAQLKAEGRYEAVQELHRRQEEERQKKLAEWRKAAAPLVEELNRSGGVTVESVWDLVNTEAPYPAAIPILLDHLDRPYPERVREGIARALAVPQARVGWNTLLNAFNQETDNSTTGVKWALALALGATGTDAVLEDVLPLLRDRSLGRNRAPLLSILGRSRDSRSSELLQELADDKDLARDVEKILRRRQKRRPETKSSKYVN